jgi:hypothetical protein
VSAIPTQIESIADGTGRSLAIDSVIASPHPAALMTATTTKDRTDREH